MNEQLDEKLATGVRAVSPAMKTAGDFLLDLFAKKQTQIPEGVLRRLSS